MDKSYPIFSFNTRGPWHLDCPIELSLPVPTRFPRRPGLDCPTLVVSKQNNKKTAHAALHRGITATAIMFGRLRAPGLSTRSRRSFLTASFTSSSDSPMRPLRLCCTAPALRFLAVDTQSTGRSLSCPMNAPLLLYSSLPQASEANRGSTAVLLGKSTTTTKGPNEPRAGGRAETLFIFCLILI